MPQPRYRLVDTETTSCYHCISRCVHRAFLCDYNKVSRKRIAHRLDQKWLGGITQAKAFYHQQVYNQQISLHRPLLAERQSRLN